MTEAEYAQKLEELDRQLNDPVIPLDAARVWALSADLCKHATGSEVALSDALPNREFPLTGHMQVAPHKSVPLLACDVAGSVTHERSADCEPGAAHNSTWPIQKRGRKQRTPAKLQQ